MMPTYYCTILDIANLIISPPRILLIHVSLISLMSLMSLMSLISLISALRQRCATLTQPVLPCACLCLLRTRCFCSSYLQIDMDGMCEWLMSRSRVAAVLCGRDGESKKAAWEAQNDEQANTEQPVRTRVISGSYTSLTGSAFNSETLDTIRLCKGVYRGKWYYEVHLGENRNMQIGFAMAGFEVEPGSGKGVGSRDTPSRSWAYDGGCQRKYSHGWISYANSIKWKAGDVVGCLLDLQQRQVSFSLNGENLGVAFGEVWAKKTEPIFPAASLKGGPHMIVFENCMYAPNDYQLFKEAPDDGLMDYEQYAESPVRKFLATSAAQQAAAWLPVTDYMNNNTLKSLPVGAPIIYADTGTTGEVAEWTYKGNNHVISMYDEELAEASTADEKVSKFTQNHLTVDKDFVDKYIAIELDVWMADFITKQAGLARCVFFYRFMLFLYHFTVFLYRFMLFLYHFTVFFYRFMLFLYHFTVFFYRFMLFLY